MKFPRVHLRFNGFYAQGHGILRRKTLPDAARFARGEYGRAHHRYMERLPNFAGIEISTRDTTPGRD